MTLLDRYVGRIVAGAFGAALLFFLFLSILVDLLNNLQRYAERAASEGLGGMQLALYLLWFYARLIPVLFTTLTPFACVIAGMFAVARLQNANEVVPMLFTGRSIQRVLRPILCCGLAAGLAMAVCWQWVIPGIGGALATDDAFLRQGSVVQRHLVHELHADQSQYLYVREYDPIRRRMAGVRLLVQGVLAADVSLTIADAAIWDERRQDWQLENGWLVRTRERTPQVWLERPDLAPTVLLQQSRDTIDPETMSYTDLAELAVRRPNRADVRLALHRHVTYPLANLLLLLLALPMAVRYERGSRIDGVLLAIALCGGYMLLDLTCQSLGQRGLLHPVLAAWTPTLLFGSLGVALFGGIRT